MGKRSNFKRNKGDYYQTPKTALLPLLPHLGTCELFCEPCAGDGRLIRYLTDTGHRCLDAWDIDPQGPNIRKEDARFTRCDKEITSFITNPPWSRPFLHPIIENLCAQHPTFLLFDADWVHTRQANGLWQKCSKIISIGRVKWIEDSPFVGKDNCCWYRFEPGHTSGPSFVGRH